jgi:hypothetical protein
MRKIVAAEYLSLDGVTEDPGPAGEFKDSGWTLPYWNDELAEYQSELLFASDALLLGRVTYPLALASGKRLFKEGGERTTLTLSDAKTTSTGVVVLTYEAAKAASANH